MPTQLKKDLSQVTCLVADQGLFVELAVTLAETFKKVYYYCPGWTSAFPKVNNTMIGTGLPGIEVVKSLFGDHFDEVDLWVFPDVNFGAEQVHLQSLGKRVFGSRMGEMMELDRAFMKGEMKKRGYPVGGWRIVKGMDALREHLKTNKDQHVKISRFRGSFETFRSPNYKFVEPKLDEVEQSLGAFKHMMEFIVEDDLPDKFEIGSDMYSIDGQFPTKTLAGIEIKDEGFVGIFKARAEFPEQLTRFDKVMSPLLKDFGYRGFYSTEVRIGKDKVPYMIDFCGRAASPPNELYQAFYLNLAEIIWEGAGGVCVDPKPAAKYGAEALIHSAWADKGYQPLEIPDEIRPYVKLRNAVKINSRYYVVPQAVGLPEIGAVVGWGDTMEQAIDMVREVAEQVKGYYVEIKLDAFERAQEEISKSEEFGFKIF